MRLGEGYWGASGRKWMTVGGLLGAAVVSEGCAPRPAPAPAAAPQPEPPEEESRAEESSEGESAPASVVAEAPNPQQEPPQVIATICAETCKKVGSSCSERAASFCEASCRDYVNGADKCPSEIRDALSCQQNADDFLLCSNIAAESCGPLYKKMQECRDGKVAPRPWGETQVVKTGEDIPAGFKRLEIAAWGISVLVPEGAQLEAGAGGAVRLEAEDTQGIRYIVETAEGDGKPHQTPASILRAATRYVGNPCQPKLRLHGRYETQGVIHTRFDTVCADGAQIRGMMHFWEGRVVAASTRRAAPGENPNLEPFLFGFVRTDGAVASSASGE